MHWQGLRHHMDVLLLNLASQKNSFLMNFMFYWCIWRKHLILLFSGEKLSDTLKVSVCRHQTMSMRISFFCIVTTTLNNSNPILLQNIVLFYCHHLPPQNLTYFHKMHSEAIKGKVLNTWAGSSYLTLMCYVWKKNGEHIHFKEISSSSHACKHKFFILLLWGGKLLSPLIETESVPTSWCPSNCNPYLQDATGIKVSKGARYTSRHFMPYMDMLHLNKAWQTSKFQKI